ncbi:DEAD/DEAH box helicase [Uliginosibacterium sp. 31-16]|uniref:DEAD/DEAH box helicase n=1 Tax=Uliginosibacterium sp. 31-16 TaxID=3068315 RepID=UPI00274010E0|nr:DEAD/DEAH box helicase [Uliginosibacterium sp. 31-16]MDP5238226.1 DEAD/DEAH box helicase [Uliginosibacterium sp. 31-16]
MPFTNLGLAPALLNALAEREFTAPTAIQAAAIPAALRGEDILGSAPTGSGKSLAFALPILQQLAGLKRKSIYGAARRTHALILAPTRELAIQTGEVLKEFSAHLAEPVKVVVAFGGVSLNPQMMALRGGADIVVATPGRLLDLIDHNALSISTIATLVLDEADRLLDAGFADELQRLLALLPAQRQTLLFSATLPPAVEALADALQRTPTRIAQAADAPEIDQHALTVDARTRTQLLLHLIKQEGWTRVLVFVATKYACELVADKLARRGIHAAPLHGELSQGTRSETLAAFKAGHLHVLVATDVAARGLDIARLPVVINYDLPRAAADYAHRIGRTGRAGEPGLAISFISADTEAHFRLIEKRMGIQLEREYIDGFEPTEHPQPGAATGGVKGKRKSKKDKLREAAAAARDVA